MQHVENPADWGGALFNYSPGVDAPGLLSLPGCNSSPEGPHNWDVAALRSRPASIKPIRNQRTGSLSYRVTVTIKGKQRKKQFADLAEAQATQADWELERTLAAGALRPKITRLTHEKLRQAEAAEELLSGTEFSLIDAVRHLLRNPPAKRMEITFDDGYRRFLEAKKEHISLRQLGNYESAARRFAVFIGANTLLGDITTDQVVAWLKSLKCGKKSWNTYRDDLGALFAWFAAAPRYWISEKSPVDAVERFRKRHTSPGTPERLSVSQCRNLMVYLESERPQWVTFFATALFVGVRPDGEMSGLAAAIGREGMKKYVSDDRIQIGASFAKDGKPRTVPLAENAKRWFECYPITAESIRPGNSYEYAAIRERFKIPYDGLRHTSETACAVLNGVVTATKRHGNSPTIANNHYLSEMTPEEAKDFYAIFPTVARFVS